MTTQQVIALIVSSAFMLGLLTYAYLTGRIQGRAISDSKNAEKLKELEAALELLRSNNQRLTAQARALELNRALKDHHLSTLLQIADNLRLAAETWSAFKTGKKLERDARRLRNEALAIASLLKPTEQEAAA